MLRGEPSVETGRTTVTVTALRNLLWRTHSSSLEATHLVVYGGITHASWAKIGVRSATMSLGFRGLMIYALSSYLVDMYCIITIQYCFSSRPLSIAFPVRDGNMHGDKRSSSLPAFPTY